MVIFRILIPIFFSFTSSAMAGMCGTGQIPDLYSQKKRCEQALSFREFYKELFEFKGSAHSKDFSELLTSQYFAFENGSNGRFPAPNPDAIKAWKAAGANGILPGTKNCRLSKDQYIPRNPPLFNPECKIPAW